MAYDYQPFPYVPPPGLTGPEPRHKVAIVGAGPIGLALAIDLAQRGVGSVVLDDNNVVSVGSRAICWAKRTLEIFGGLGVGDRMLAKGVTWKVGRTFFGQDEVYNFDLLPEADHKYPAFINLQQYYVEEYLIDRARDFPGLIDLRFKNRVADHADRGDHVALSVETPDGGYALETQYLVACDGARSPTRARMGLAFTGQEFDENFLIVDVEMAQSPFGTETPERWFWFAPPFHDGQSALLHKQPDNIYRIDLQLGPDADVVTEAQEDRVIPRIRAILGDAPFRLDWHSIYRFRCARLDSFVHGRVVFAGDSAHVVSPFGARGGNGGIQDVDALGWRLAALLSRAAPDLLTDYDRERQRAADENILNSSRATSFMTPKTAMEHLFRDQILDLARKHAFARSLVNSGRLSRPHDLGGLVSGPTCPHARVSPGAVVVDAPTQDGWLVDRVQGDWTLVAFGNVVLPETQVRCLSVTDPVALDRYGAGVAVLFRPDGIVAGCFAAPTAADISTCLATAGVPA